MRVGIISLYHESNTFNPRPTTLDDFKAQRFLVGAAARSQDGWGNHEVAGFIEGLARERIEAIPLFAAWALPGGVIAGDEFTILTQEMERALIDAGPLDGVLVAPHGAAVSESAADADDQWLRMVRARTGDHLPIVGTIDPHANLSALMIEMTDALTAYRTNPHLDQRQRGVEAATLIARTLRGEIIPTQAAMLTPLIINIERQRCDQSPCLDLQKAAREIGGRGGMLSSSVVLGFPYADVAEMGAAAIAVADGDAALADRAAGELGGAIWKHRHDLKGQLLDPIAALQRARSLPGPVCLLDMGDNVGGGSPGDGTGLAHLLNRPDIGKSFVSLYDPASADMAIKAGVGATLMLDMGGNSGPPYGPALCDRVTVTHVSAGVFTDLRPRHGGITHYDIGPLAVAMTGHGLSVMLTTRRTFPVSLVQLTSCGLDPSKFRYIVAKGVHAPVTAYEEVCKSFIRVNTPGITSADLDSFDYVHRRRPLFPLEDETKIETRIVRGHLL
ncbi:MAG TPA: M81 family metallopeptidase [Tepidisphaeraceae bacterium]|jgi:microcystin degradation protein MlrC|nr:M81 family metallopeptidase [Tepidisphaeraceae bacterium]